MHENFRRLAETRLVPFDRRGEKLAVAIAAGYVGERHAWQLAGFGEALAARFDHAFGFKLRKQLFQRNAVAALDVEGARDLALADFLRRPAVDVALPGNEGENVVARGERMWFCFGLGQ